MKIIIGLGNPGEKYKNTRHNIGFMMIDKLKESYNFPDFEFNKKFNAEASKGNIDNEEVLLVKPQTFMNNSGEAVRIVMDFYKLSPDDIIVIHDDIDLPIEKYKTTESSSSAGHNGVQDMIDKIGTQNFRRIRIGVANEKLRNPIGPSDFVLQEFSEEELKAIENISGEIIKKIKDIL